MTILQENWKDLIKTSDIEVEKLNDKKSIMVISPLEKGYGTTLGNAIRRVLLTSLGGFAVTSVRIDGVFHEYDLISGIREDVYEIIMNIKSLLFVKNTATPSKLYIKVNKKGQVLARDIKIEGGGEISNGELVICNIEKDAVQFNVEMTVEYGVGYVPAILNDDKKVLGVIRVDAVFTPIKNATFRVGSARIGQKIDYDRLELEVETNGTITPVESVAIASKILQSQLDVFVNFVMKDEESKIDDDDDEMFNVNPSFLKRIDEMELSVRSSNCLKSEGIIYVGDLIQKSEADMMKLANFGRKSLNELKTNLTVLGLSFGMKIDNWEAIVASYKKKRK
jgi:DNA-directed RNA polymerase subunit alpha